MHARLWLQYGVLALTMLIGPEMGRMAAESKRATPPTAKDLVGVWIGFDSDELTFTPTHSPPLLEIRPRLQWRRRSRRCA